VNTLFAIVLAALFGVLGVAKLAAVPAMRTAAHHLGFSVGQYRAIGALELAGAAGVALGPAVPAIGIAAGLGITLLMVSAAVAHVAHRDGPGRVAVALCVAGVAATYMLIIG
jgi:hypothetical protein